MNNTELRGKWNKRKRKEIIARCYLSAVIIDCYWYCSLFIRLYFNGSYCTQSRRAAIESETIAWNDMSIVMRPYVWSHTLQTWRRFYVNYRQIGRCRRCFVTFYSREWTFIQRIHFQWSHLSIVRLSLSHAHSRTKCNRNSCGLSAINKTNRTVIYDKISKRWL